MNEKPSSRRIPLALRVKRFLPRSLFGRTLLIFVIPTFIMLAAATYVFFDRHWYTVTRRMTHPLAGDVSFVINLLEKNSDPYEEERIKGLALETMQLDVGFSSEARLPSEGPLPGAIAVILNRSLEQLLKTPYVLDMASDSETIAIYVQGAEGVYTVFSPQKRVYTPTTQVFILWMTGSSILMTFVALLFMRNQIRPIRRLAAAAEAIGKGREVPWFKIEGASEVRQAAAALMVMRDRLQRQISQRTAMLAGVSHDLRTPLTRMRLQIELMGDSAETEELSSDISEMEAMLNAYLAFARGEEAETAQPTDMEALLQEVVASARRQNPNVELRFPAACKMIVRRNAVKRCLTNLLGNALRYGKRAEVSVEVNDQALVVFIDDDGSGIPSALREEMFRPFTRAEESRNQATGGVGLGLTIARDVARAHGGDVVLEDSPIGGTRAKAWFPL